jgi:DnaJ-class molecular chaperone
MKKIKRGPCPNCDGTGIVDKGQCIDCNGEGYVDIIEAPK